MSKITESNGASSSSLSNKNNSLFPTTTSLIIFISYMTLFINQGILVTASQDSNRKYNYNTISAVLLTEAFKLLISVIMYINQNSLRAYIEEIKINWKAFLYYLPTAFLYCLYNNLAYTNLATFDPTTYFLLLQLRVGVTGVVFQILFKHKLSSYQWFSLLLLMVGCMIKEIKLDSLSLNFSPGIILILLQVCSSSSAGVYNEYLLKRQTKIPLLFQNTCLYVDSVFCNLLILGVEGNLTTGLNSDSIRNLLFIPINFFVIMNNVAIGIVTSFFLSHLNSILKTFASALELSFTAVLSYLLFGIPIYFNTVLSVIVVSFAVWMYSKKPVDNRTEIKYENKNEPKMNLPSRATEKLINV